jgi:hypothetical protein
LTVQLTPNQPHPAVSASPDLRDAHAERMRRALHRMVGGLLAFRRGGWRFKDVQRGRYSVDHALLTLIDSAIDAGATEEQAMEPIRALGAYVKSRFPAQLAPLPELIQRETEAEGRQNEAVIALLNDPSPAHKAAVASTSRAHAKLLYLCAERADREILAADFPRPMGVPRVTA